VKPVLGIVAEIFLNRESNKTAGEVYKTMVEVPRIHDEMFPKMFDFVSEQGVTRKQLFGSSIEWLVRFLVQKPKIEIIAAVEGRERQVSIGHVSRTSLQSIDKGIFTTAASAKLSL